MGSGRRSVRLPKLGSPTDAGPGGVGAAPQRSERRIVDAAKLDEHRPGVVRHDAGPVLANRVGVGTGIADGVTDRPGTVRASAGVLLQHPLDAGVVPNLLGKGRITLE